MAETTLVVVAHPEPRSFNGSWAQASVNASRELGHTVLFSDLVADGFNPVESAARYRDHGDLFDPLKAQEQAAETGTLPQDVAAEMEKIIAADRVIVHFPLWWFGPPAILKGWLDRCLVHGALHTVDSRFDQGHCTDKKVMLCATTGASASECAFSGKEGDINMLLWPVAYTFRYLGFAVAQSQVVHGVHGYFEGAERSALENKLKTVLLQHKSVIERFDSLPLEQFNTDTDFDETGRLRDEAVSYNAFIRHKE